VVRGMVGSRILYPVGHLFRPSCVGLHRIPENPGPQGTGLGIPGDPAGGRGAWRNRLLRKRQLGRMGRLCRIWLCGARDGW
jgi:hypothetical protein